MILWLGRGNADALSYAYRLNYKLIICNVTSICISITVGFFAIIKIVSDDVYEAEALL